MSALVEGWRRLAPNARGTILILVYAAHFAGADVAAKFLARDINLFQILFLRYLLSIGLIFPVVLYLGIGSLATTRPLLHAGRSAISFAAQLLVYYALVHMFVADVTAIGFARPLFVTLLAVVLLSERVAWRRWAATTVGFIGVIVMVRPDASGIGPPALAAITATCMFGLALVLVRRYATREAPITFIFYYHVAGLVLSAVPALVHWQPMTREQFLVVALIALLSTLAQTFGILAYSVGEASVVGPVEYFRLMFAALLGYAVFLEVPGPGTWIGAAIIIGSAVYITRHEATRRRLAQGTGG